MTPSHTLSLLNQTADAALGSVQNGEIYRSIESSLHALIGFKLLTILRVRGDRVYRMHTSDLVAYPTGGFKSIHDDPWLQTMLGQGAPVVSPDPETVRQRFFDHQAIAELGCGAVMNLPVTCAAGTLGSVNLLHEAHWFTPHHVQVARLFSTQLAVAWLGQEAPLIDTWPTRPRA